MSSNLNRLDQLLRGTSSTSSTNQAPPQSSGSLSPPHTPCSRHHQQHNNAVPTTTTSHHHHTTTTTTTSNIAGGGSNSDTTGGGVSLDSSSLHHHNYPTPNTAVHGNHYLNVLLRGPSPFTPHAEMGGSVGANIGRSSSLEKYTPPTQSGSSVDTPTISHSEHELQHNHNGGTFTNDVLPRGTSGSAFSPSRMKKPRTTATTKRTTPTTPHEDVATAAVTTASSPLPRRNSIANGLQPSTPPLHSGVRPLSSNPAPLLFTTRRTSMMTNTTTAGSSLATSPASPLRTTMLKSLLSTPFRHGHNHNNMGALGTTPVSTGSSPLVHASSTTTIAVPEVSSISTPRLITLPYQHRRRTGNASSMSLLETTDDTLDEVTAILGITQSDLPRPDLHHPILPPSTEEIETPKPSLLPSSSGTAAVPLHPQQQPQNSHSSSGGPPPPILLPSSPPKRNSGGPSSPSYQKMSGGAAAAASFSTPSFGVVDATTTGGGLNSTDVSSTYAATTGGDGSPPPPPPHTATVTSATATGVVSPHTKTAAAAGTTDNANTKALAPPPTSSSVTPETRIQAALVKYGYLPKDNAGTSFIQPISTTSHNHQQQASSSSAAAATTTATVPTEEEDLRDEVTGVVTRHFAEKLKRELANIYFLLLTSQWLTRQQQHPHPQNLPPQSAGSSISTPYQQKLAASSSHHHSQQVGTPEDTSMATGGKDEAAAIEATNRVFRHYIYRLHLVINADDHESAAGPSSSSLAHSPPTTARTSATTTQINSDASDAVTSTSLVDHVARAGKNVKISKGATQEIMSIVSTCVNELLTATNSSSSSSTPPPSPTGVEEGGSGGGKNPLPPLSPNTTASLNPEAASSHYQSYPPIHFGALSLPHDHDDDVSNQPLTIRTPISPDFFPPHPHTPSFITSDMNLPSMFGATHHHHHHSSSGPPRTTNLQHTLSGGSNTSNPANRRKSTGSCMLSSNNNNNSNSNNTNSSTVGGDALQQRLMRMIGGGGGGGIWPSSPNHVVTYNNSPSTVTSGNSSPLSSRVRAKTFANATSSPKNAHFSPLSTSSQFQPPGSGGYGYGHYHHNQHHHSHNANPSFQSLHSVPMSSSGNNFSNVFSAGRKSSTGSQFPIQNLSFSSGSSFAPRAVMSCSTSQVGSTPRLQYARLPPSRRVSSESVSAAGSFISNSFAFRSSGNSFHSAQAGASGTGFQMMNRRPSLLYTNYQGGGGGGGMGGGGDGGGGASSQDFSTPGGNSCRSSFSKVLSLGSDEDALSSNNGGGSGGNNNSNTFPQYQGRVVHKYQFRTNAEDSPFRDDLDESSSPPQYQLNPAQYQQHSPTSTPIAEAQPSKGELLYFRDVTPHIESEMPLIFSKLETATTTKVIELSGKRDVANGVAMRRPLVVSSLSGRIDACMKTALKRVLHLLKVIQFIEEGVGNRMPKNTLTKTTTTATGEDHNEDDVSPSKPASPIFRKKAATAKASLDSRRRRRQQKTISFHPVDAILAKVLEGAYTDVETILVRISLVSPTMSANNLNSSAAWLKSRTSSSQRLSEFNNSSTSGSPRSHRKSSVEFTSDVIFDDSVRGPAGGSGGGHPASSSLPFMLPSAHNTPPNTTSHPPILLTTSSSRQDVIIASGRASRQPTAPPGATFTREGGRPLAGFDTRRTSAFSNNSSMFQRTTSQIGCDDSDEQPSSIFQPVPNPNRRGTVTSPYDNNARPSTSTPNTNASDGSIHSLSRLQPNNGSGANLLATHTTCVTSTSPSSSPPQSAIIPSPPPHPNNSVGNERPVLASFPTITVQRGSVGAVDVGKGEEHQQGGGRVEEEPASPTLAVDGTAQEQSTSSTIGDPLTAKKMIATTALTKLLQPPPAYHHSTPGGGAAASASCDDSTSKSISVVPSIMFPAGLYGEGSRSSPITTNTPVCTGGEDAMSSAAARWGALPHTYVEGGLMMQPPIPSSSGGDSPPYSGTYTVDGSFHPPSPAIAITATTTSPLTTSYHQNNNHNVGGSLGSSPSQPVFKGPNSESLFEVVTTHRRRGPKTRSKAINRNNSAESTPTETTTTDTNNHHISEFMMAQNDDVVGEEFSTPAVVGCGGGIGASTSYFSGLHPSTGTSMQNSISGAPDTSPSLLPSPNTAPLAPHQLQSRISGGLHNVVNSGANRTMSVGSLFNSPQATSLSQPSSTNMASILPSTSIGSAIHNNNNTTNITSATKNLPQPLSRYAPINTLPPPARTGSLPSHVDSSTPATPNSFGNSTPSGGAGKGAPPGGGAKSGSTSQQWALGSYNSEHSYLAKMYGNMSQVSSTSIQPSHHHLSATHHITATGEGGVGGGGDSGSAPSISTPPHQGVSISSANGTRGTSSSSIAVMANAVMMGPSSSSTPPRSRSSAIMEILGKSPPQRHTSESSGGAEAGGTATVSPTRQGNPLSCATEARHVLVNIVTANGETVNVLAKGEECWGVSDDDRSYASGTSSNGPASTGTGATQSVIVPSGQNISRHDVLRGILADRTRSRPASEFREELEMCVYEPISLADFSGRRQSVSSAAGADSFRQRSASSRVYPTPRSQKTSPAVALLDAAVVTTKQKSSDGSSSFRSDSLCTPVLHSSVKATSGTFSPSALAGAIQHNPPNNNNNNSIQRLYPVVMVPPSNNNNSPQHQSGSGTPSSSIPSFDSDGVVGGPNRHHDVIFVEKSLSPRGRRIRSGNHHSPLNQPDYSASRTPSTAPSSTVNRTPLRTTTPAAYNHPHRNHPELSGTPPSLSQTELSRACSKGSSSQRGGENDGAPPNALFFLHTNNNTANPNHTGSTNLGSTTSTNPNHRSLAALLNNSSLAELFPVVLPSFDSDRTVAMMGRPSPLLLPSTASTPAAAVNSATSTKHNAAVTATNSGRLNEIISKITKQYMGSVGSSSLPADSATHIPTVSSSCAASHIPLISESTPSEPNLSVSALTSHHRTVHHPTRGRNSNNNNPHRTKSPMRGVDIFKTPQSTTYDYSISPENDSATGGVHASASTTSTSQHNTYHQYNQQHGSTSSSLFRPAARSLSTVPPFGHTPNNKTFMSTFGDSDTLPPPEAILTLHGANQLHPFARSPTTSPTTTATTTPSNPSPRHAPREFVRRVSSSSSGNNKDITFVPSDVTAPSAAALRKQQHTPLTMATPAIPMDTLNVSSEAGGAGESVVGSGGSTIMLHHIATIPISGSSHNNLLLTGSVGSEVAISTSTAVGATSTTNTVASNTSAAAITPPQQPASSGNVFQHGTATTSSSQNNGDKTEENWYSPDGSVENHSNIHQHQHIISNYNTHNTNVSSSPSPSTATGFTNDSFLARCALNLTPPNSSVLPAMSSRSVAAAATRSASAGKHSSAPSAISVSPPSAPLTPYQIQTPPHATQLSGNANSQRTTTPTSNSSFASHADALNKMFGGKLPTYQNHMHPHNQAPTTVGTTLATNNSGSIPTSPTPLTSNTTPPSQLSPPTTPAATQETATTTTTNNTSSTAVGVSSSHHSSNFATSFPTVRSPILSIPAPVIDSCSMSSGPVSVTTTGNNPLSGDATADTSGSTNGGGGGGPHQFQLQNPGSSGLGAPPPPIGGAASDCFSRLSSLSGMSPGGGGGGPLKLPSLSPNSDHIQSIPSGTFTSPPGSGASSSARRSLGSDKASSFIIGGGGQQQHIGVASSTVAVGTGGGSGGGSGLQQLVSNSTRNSLNSDSSDTGTNLTNSKGGTSTMKNRETMMGLPPQHPSPTTPKNNTMPGGIGTSWSSGHFTSFDSVGEHKSTHLFSFPPLLGSDRSRTPSSGDCGGDKNGTLGPASGGGPLRNNNHNHIRRQSMMSSVSVTSGRQVSSSRSIAVGEPLIAFDTAAACGSTSGAGGGVHTSNMIGSQNSSMGHPLMGPGMYSLFASGFGSSMQQANDSTASLVTKAGMLIELFITSVTSAPSTSTPQHPSNSNIIGVGGRGSDSSSLHPQPSGGAVQPTTSTGTINTTTSNSHSGTGISSTLNANLVSHPAGSGAASSSAFTHHLGIGAGSTVGGTSSSANTAASSLLPHHSFTAADLSAVTGVPVREVREALGAMSSVHRHRLQVIRGESPPSLSFTNQQHGSNNGNYNRPPLLGGSSSLPGGSPHSIHRHLLGSGSSELNNPPTGSIEPPTAAMNVLLEAVDFKMRSVPSPTHTDSETDWGTFHLIMPPQPADPASTAPQPLRPSDYTATGEDGSASIGAAVAGSSMTAVIDHSNPSQPTSSSTVASAVPFILLPADYYNSTSMSDPAALPFLVNVPKPPTPPPPQEPAATTTTAVSPSSPLDDGIPTKKRRNSIRANPRPLYDAADNDAEEDHHQHNHELHDSGLQRHTDETTTGCDEEEEWSSVWGDRCPTNGRATSTTRAQHPQQNHVDQLAGQSVTSYESKLTLNNFSARRRSVSLSTEGAPISTGSAKYGNTTKAGSPVGKGGEVPIIGIGIERPKSIGVSAHSFPHMSNSNSSFNCTTSPKVAVLVPTTSFINQTVSQSSTPTTSASFQHTAPTHPEKKSSRSSRNQNPGASGSASNQHYQLRRRASSDWSFRSIIGAGTAIGASADSGGGGGGGTVTTSTTSPSPRASCNNDAAKNNNAAANSSTNLLGGPTMNHSLSSIPNISFVAHHLVEEGRNVRNNKDSSEFHTSSSEASENSSPKLTELVTGTVTTNSGSGNEKDSGGMKKASLSQNTNNTNSGSCLLRQATIQDSNELGLDTDGVSSNTTFQSRFEGGGIGNNSLHGNQYLLQQQRYSNATNLTVSDDGAPPSSARHSNLSSTTGLGDMSSQQRSTTSSHHQLLGFLGTNTSHYSSNNNGGGGGGPLRPPLSQERPPPSPNVNLATLGSMVSRRGSFPTGGGASSSQLQSAFSWAFISPDTSTQLVGQSTATTPPSRVLLGNISPMTPPTAPSPATESVGGGGGVSSGDIHAQGQNVRGIMQSSSSHTSSSSPLQTLLSSSARPVVLPLSSSPTTPPRHYNHHHQQPDVDDLGDVVSSSSMIREKDSRRRLEQIMAHPLFGGAGGSRSSIANNSSSTINTTTTRSVYLPGSSLSDNHATYPNDSNTSRSHLDSLSSPMFPRHNVPPSHGSMSRVPPFFVHSSSTTSESVATADQNNNNTTPIRHSNMVTVTGASRSTSTTHNSSRAPSMVGSPTSDGPPLSSSHHQASGLTSTLGGSQSHHLAPGGAGGGGLYSAAFLHSSFARGGSFVGSFSDSSAALFATRNSQLLNDTHIDRNPSIFHPQLPSAVATLRSLGHTTSHPSSSPRSPGTHSSQNADLHLQHSHRTSTSLLRSSDSMYPQSVRSSAGGGGGAVHPVTSGDVHAILSGARYHYGSSPTPCTSSISGADHSSTAFTGANWIGSSTTSIRTNPQSSASENPSVNLQPSMATPYTTPGSMRGRGSGQGGRDLSIDDDFGHSSRQSIANPTIATTTSSSNTPASQAAQAGSSINQLRRHSSVDGFLPSFIGDINKPRVGSFSFNHESDALLNAARQFQDTMSASSSQLQPHPTLRSNTVPNNNNSSSNNPHYSNSNNSHSQVVAPLHRFEPPSTSTNVFDGSSSSYNYGGGASRHLIESPTAQLTVSLSAAPPEGSPLLPLNDGKRRISTLTVKSATSESTPMSDRLVLPNHHHSPPTSHRQGSGTNYSWSGEVSLSGLPPMGASQHHHPHRHSNSSATTSRTTPSSHPRSSVPKSPEDLKSFKLGSPSNGPITFETPKHGPPLSADNWNASTSALRDGLVSYSSSALESSSQLYGGGHHHQHHQLPPAPLPPPQSPSSAQQQQHQQHNVSTHMPIIPDKRLIQTAGGKMQQQHHTPSSSPLGLSGKVGGPVLESTTTTTSSNETPAATINNGGTAHHQALRDKSTSSSSPSSPTRGAQSTPSTTTGTAGRLVNPISISTAPSNAASPTHVGPQLVQVPSMTENVVDNYESTPTSTVASRGMFDSSRRTTIENCPASPSSDTAMHDSLGSRYPPPLLPSMPPLPLTPLRGDSGGGGDSRKPSFHNVAPNIPQTVHPRPVKLERSSMGRTPSSTSSSPIFNREATCSVMFDNTTTTTTTTASDRGSKSFSPPQLNQTARGADQLRALLSASTSSPIKQSNQTSSSSSTVLATTTTAQEVEVGALLQASSSDTKHATITTTSVSMADKLKALFTNPSDMASATTSTTDTTTTPPPSSMSDRLKRLFLDMNENEKKDSVDPNTTTTATTKNTTPDSSTQSQQRSVPETSIVVESFEHSVEEEYSSPLSGSKSDRIAALRNILQGCNVISSSIIQASGAGEAGDSLRNQIPLSQRSTPRPILARSWDERDIAVLNINNNPNSRSITCLSDAYLLGIHNGGVDGAGDVSGSGNIPGNSTESITTMSLAQQGITAIAPPTPPVYGDATPPHGYSHTPNSDATGLPPPHLQEIIPTSTSNTPVGGGGEKPTTVPEETPDQTFADPPNVPTTTSASLVPLPPPPSSQAIIQGVSTAPLEQGAQSVVVVTTGRVRSPLQPPSTKDAPPPRNRPHSVSRDTNNNNNSSIRQHIESKNSSNSQHQDVARSMTSVSRTKSSRGSQNPSYSSSPAPPPPPPINVVAVRKLREVISRMNVENYFEPGEAEVIEEAVKSPPLDAANTAMNSSPLDNASVRSMSSNLTQDVIASAGGGGGDGSVLRSSTSTTTHTIDGDPHSNTAATRAASNTPSSPLGGTHNKSCTRSSSTATTTNNDVNYTSSSRNATDGANTTSHNITSMSSPLSSPGSQHHNDSTGGVGSSSTGGGGGGSATRATTRIKKRKPWSSLNLRFSIPGDVCIDIHASMAAWAQQSVSNMGGGSSRVAASSTGTSNAGGGGVGQSSLIPSHSTSSRLSITPSDINNNNTNSVDHRVPENNSPSRGPSYGTSISLTPPRGAAITGTSLSSDAHLPQLPRSPVVANNNKSSNNRPHPIVVPPPPLSPEQLAHSGSNSGNGRRPPHSYTSAPSGYGSPNDLHLSSPHSDNYTPSQTSTLYSPPPREFPDHTTSDTNHRSPLAATTTGGGSDGGTATADSSVNNQSRQQQQRDVGGTATLPSSLNIMTDSSVRLNHSPAMLPPLSRRFGSADRGVSPVGGGGNRATSISNTDGSSIDVGSTAIASSFGASYNTSTMGASRMQGHGGSMLTTDGATTEPEVSVSGHEVSKSQIMASSALGDVGESNGELPAVVGLTIPNSSSTTGSDPSRSRDNHRGGGDSNDINHNTTTTSGAHSQQAQKGNTTTATSTMGSTSSTSIDSSSSIPIPKQSQPNAASSSSPATVARAPSANKSFKTHYLPAAVGGGISYGHSPMADSQQYHPNNHTNVLMASAAHHNPSMVGGPSSPGSGSSSPSQTYSRVQSPLTPGLISPSASLSRVPTGGGVKMRTKLHPDYYLYDWTILDLVPQGAKKKVGKKEFPEYRALALKKLDDLEALASRQNVVLTSPRSSHSMHSGNSLYPPLPPPGNSSANVSPSISPQQYYQQQQTPRSKLLNSQSQQQQQGTATTMGTATNNYNSSSAGQAHHPPSSEGLIGVSIGVASSSDGNSMSTLRSSLNVGSTEITVTTSPLRPLASSNNNSTGGRPAAVVGGGGVSTSPPKSTSSTPSPTR